MRVFNNLTTDPLVGPVTKINYGNVPLTYWFLMDCDDVEGFRNRYGAHFLPGEKISAGEVA